MHAVPTVPHQQVEQLRASGRIPSWPGQDPALQRAWTRLEAAETAVWLAATAKAGCQPPSLLLVCACLSEPAVQAWLTRWAAKSRAFASSAPGTPRLDLILQAQVRLCDGAHTCRASPAQQLDALLAGAATSAAAKAQLSGPAALRVHLPASSALEHGSPKRAQPAGRTAAQPAGSSAPQRSQLPPAFGSAAFSPSSTPQASTAPPAAATAQLSGPAALRLKPPASSVLERRSSKRAQPATTSTAQPAASSCHSLNHLLPAGTSAAHLSRLPPAAFSPSSGTQQPAASSAALQEQQLLPPLLVAPGVLPELLDLEPISPVQPSAAEPQLHPQLHPQLQPAFTMPGHNPPASPGTHQGSARVLVRYVACSAAFSSGSAGQRKAILNPTSLLTSSFGCRARSTWQCWRPCMPSCAASGMPTP